MGEKDRINKSMKYLGRLNTDNISKENSLVTLVDRFNKNLDEQALLLLIQYSTQVDGLKNDIDFLLSTLWNQIEVESIEELYEDLIDWTFDWYGKLLQVHTLKNKYENSFGLLLSNISQLRCLLKICLETQQLYHLNDSWCDYSISDLRESINIGEQLNKTELDLRNKISINYDTDVLYHYDYSEVSQLLNSLHTEFSPNLLEKLFDYSSIKELEGKARELYSFFCDFEQMLDKITLKEHQNVLLTEGSIESIYELLVLLQENNSIPDSWMSHDFYNYHKIMELIKESETIQNDFNSKLTYYSQYFSKESLNCDDIYNLDDAALAYYHENSECLHEDIKNLMHHIHQLNKINCDLTELLGYEANNTIHGILEMLDLLYGVQEILYCEDTWLNEEELEVVKNQCASLMNKISEVKSMKQKILLEFKEEIFEYFNPNLNHRFSKEFVSILRVLKKQYREDMKQLNLLYKGETKLSFSQAHKLILTLSEYNQKLDQMNCQLKQNEHVFGHLNNGLDTDFKAIEKNYEAFDKFINQGKLRGLSSKELKTLINSNINIKKLDEYQVLYNSSINGINQILKNHQPLLSKLENYEFEGVQDITDIVTKINLEMSTSIKAINQILNYAVGEVPNITLFKSLMDIRNQIKVDMNDSKRLAPSLEIVFGEDYQGLNTEWNIIKSKLVWFEKVRSCILNIPTITSENLKRIFEMLLSLDNSDRLDQYQRFSNRISQIKPIYELFIGDTNHTPQFNLDDVKVKLLSLEKLLHSWSQLVSYLSLYRNTRVSTFSDLEKELNSIVDYSTLRRKVGEVGPLFRSQFGKSYRGIVTDWVKISDSLDYYIKVQMILSENSIKLTEELWCQLTKSKSIITTNELIQEAHIVRYSDAINEKYNKYFSKAKIDINSYPLSELVDYFKQLNQESTMVFKLKQYLVLKSKFKEKGFGELFEQLMLKKQKEIISENNQRDFVFEPLKCQHLLVEETTDVIEKNYLITNSEFTKVDLDINEEEIVSEDMLENNSSIASPFCESKDTQEPIDDKLNRVLDFQISNMKTEDLTDEEVLKSEIETEKNDEIIIEQNNLSSSQISIQAERIDLDENTVRETNLSRVEEKLGNQEDNYEAEQLLKNEQNFKTTQIILPNRNVQSKAEIVNQNRENSKTKRMSDKGLNKIYSKLKLQYNLKVDNRILEAKDLKYPSSEFSFTYIYNELKTQLESLQDQYGTQIPLGLIYLDEKQYEYLKFYTKDVIQTYHDTFDHPTALLITVCLVQIIEREFDGNDFWGSIFKGLKLKDSTQLRRLLQEATQALCVYEDLYFHFTTHEKKIRRNYRSTIMMHAIVSNKSSQSLFDFMYDFYLEDLNEMYQDNMVHEKLTELIGLIDEDLDWSKGEMSVSEVDSGSIYQLSCFTKMAIVYYESVLIEVLKNIIYNMHSFQFKTKDYKSDPIRFYELYRQWRSQLVVRNLINESSISKTSKNNVVRKTHQRRFSKASYALRERQVMLCIPEQLIDKKYVHCNLYIEFYEEDSCLAELTRELELYGKVNFKTDEIEIVLDKLYKKLSYKILADNIIIYDSKELLYREYLTFDEQLKEKIYSKQPEHPFYLITNQEDLVTIDGFYNEYREKGYNLYSLELEKEDQVVLNNQVLFNQVLPEGMKRCILDSIYLREDVKIETPSNEYQIYNQFPSLKFSLYNSELSDYVFEVNGNLYEMKSLPHIMLDQHNERLKKYEFGFSSEIFNPGELYSFVIRKKIDNQIVFSAKFAVISRLNYKLDKEFYYQDKVAEIINLEAEGISLLEQSFPIAKDIRYVNEVKFDCLIMDKLKVNLVITVPKISWILSEKFNSEQDSCYLLADELYQANELTLSVPYTEYHLIATGKNGVKFIEPVREGRYKLDSLKNLEEDYITIGLLIPQTSVQIPLFEVWYHATLKNITFEYISGEEPKIQIDYDRVGEFIGTVKLYNSRKELLNEGNIDSNMENNLLIDAKVSRERCLVQVIQLIEDEFGFSSEEVIIFEMTFFAGDDLLSEVKDNVLEVKLCDVDGIHKVVNNFYLTDFKVIREGVDYEAIGFYKKERAGVLVSQKLDDKINPINIHILGRQQNKLQFTLTDNAGDGFVYHKESQKLAYLNTKDRESYDYPDFYLLDLHK